MWFWVTAYWYTVHRNIRDPLSVFPRRGLFRRTAGKPRRPRWQYSDPVEAMGVPEICDPDCNYDLGR